MAVGVDHIDEPAGRIGMRQGAEQLNCENPHVAVAIAEQRLDERADILRHVLQGVDRLVAQVGVIEPQERQQAADHGR